jgi:hypothetical protein
MVGETMQNRIFSFDSAKAIKAQGFGYLNAIHYMAPADLAGVGNLCPKASAVCKALCLGWFSGQAGMVANEADLNSVRKSRIDKARRFMKSRADYMADVVHSIELAEKKAQRMGLKLCVRMNGSTDIAFEGISCERQGKRFSNLMEAFPKLQFVDYTKIAARLTRKLPENYHLTLSHTEKNKADVLAVVRRGLNAAVVFESIPQYWQGLPVIDGDKHDLRHLDPQGVIVGLLPKGRKAKRDESGFVVRGAA